MTIHLVKLCVGCESIEDLAAWQTERLKQMKAEKQKPELFHRTFQMPKRRDELLDGGSLYWVVRGVIRCRQELVGFEEDIDQDDGKRYCRIKVRRGLVPTALRTCKAFQGWRYLEPDRAPPDLSKGDTADMPAEMAAELKRLGLV